MKNKIIIAIIMICLVSGIGITAGITAIQRPDTTLDLNQTTKDALSWRLDIPNDITKYLEKTVCDVEICKTPFKIEGSIDVVIEVPHRYCSKDNHELVLTNNVTFECLEYTTYTPQEIKISTDNKIKSRLIGISNAEANRKTKTETPKDIIIKSGKTTTTIGVVIK